MRADEKPQSSIRMVIVDDDPAIAAMLSAHFSPPTYAVEVTSNGADGVAAVLRQRPDIVMLDMNMPGMNGLEALRLIREIDQKIPVVMVTANEDTARAAEALQGGGVAYVPKPFNFLHLDHIVAVFLESRARRRPTR